jgi:hypothetical protein
MLTFREFPSDSSENGQDILSGDADISAFVRKFWWHSRSSGTIEASGRFDIQGTVVNLRILAFSSFLPWHTRRPHSPTPPTAEDLLKQVAATYAHPGNFHIEVIEESVTESELQRQWSKTYRTVVRGTGNRFRIEIRSPFSSWIQVSDGTTESSYWVDAKRYTRHPLTDTKPSQHFMISGVNSEVSNAWDTITFLEPLAADSIHAIGLADETISLNGHTFPCYVVHAESNSQGTERDLLRPHLLDRQTDPRLPQNRRARSHLHA